MRRMFLTERSPFCYLVFIKTNVGEKYTMDEELLIDGWECDFEQYEYDDFEPDDIRDYL